MTVQQEAKIAICFACLFAASLFGYDVYTRSKVRMVQPSEQKIAKPSGTTKPLVEDPFFKNCQGCVIIPAVDCYDQKGNKLPDPFAKYGGVQTGCGPNQIAKPR